MRNGCPHCSCYWDDYEECCDCGAQNWDDDWDDDDDVIWDDEEDEQDH